MGILLTLLSDYKTTTPAIAPPLLLDGLSDLSAVYSLRKLRTDYAGACLRVRRDSDSAEQDIGFDTSGFVDLAAITTFLSGANGYLRSFYDQSGSNNDATQTGFAKQPAINPAATDIVNIVVFDGVNDFLNNPNIELNSDWHIASVQKIESNGGASAALLGINDSSNSMLKMAQYSNTNKLGYTNGSEGGIVNYATAISTPYGISSLIHWQRSGADVIVKMGVQESTFSFSNPFLRISEIGSFGGNYDFMKGGLSELIILDVALAPGVQAMWEADQNSYWGV